MYKKINDIKVGDVFFILNKPNQVINDVFQDTIKLTMDDKFIKETIKTITIVNNIVTDIIETEIIKEKNK